MSSRNLEDNSTTLKETPTLTPEQEYHKGSAESGSSSEYGAYSKNGTSFLALPNELQVEIMCWLNLDDIGVVRQVCKLWRKLSQSKRVWNELYARNFDSDKKFESLNDMLFWAVKAHKVPIVTFLLIKSPELLEAADRAGGFSPLYRAAQRGFLDLVRILVQRGANVESVQGDGSTPFYIAAQENRVEVAEYLIEKNCNIECVFMSGFTPMYIASEMGNLEILKLLVKSHANVNAVAERGATPIYIAAQNGHSRVVEFLIENGADAESVFNDCYKPIYIANSRGHKEVVDVLKRKGANQDGLFPFTNYT